MFNMVAGLGASSSFSSSPSVHEIPKDFAKEVEDISFAKIGTAPRPLQSGKTIAIIDFALFTIA